MGRRRRTYAGALQKGVPHGTGTLRDSKGDIYVGDRSHGEMHGSGTMYHREGVSRGQFAHNEFVTVKVG